MKWKLFCFQKSRIYLCFSPYKKALKKALSLIISEGFLARAHIFLQSSSSGLAKMQSLSKVFAAFGHLNSFSAKSNKHSNLFDSNLHMK